jgi:hypothetical protein
MLQAGIDPAIRMALRQAIVAEMHRGGARVTQLREANLVARKRQGAAA